MEHYSVKQSGPKSWDVMFRGGSVFNTDDYELALAVARIANASYRVAWYEAQVANLALATPKG